jgi:uncharacterized protein (TIGR03032 family)
MPRPSHGSKSVSAVRTARVEWTATRGFSDWMAEHETSLVLTTYKSGNLLLLGLGDNGRLTISISTFDRCMGIWASPDQLLIGTLCQLWRLNNGLPAGHTHKGHDRLYIPRLAWTTGDIDIHDIDVDPSGRPVFVSSVFSCLATVSETHSFGLLWQPPFISRIAAEDRCHLNGLATADGEPRYVTSVSLSDVADGWRDHRDAGGVVIEVPGGEVVASGLSMPHSPRIHQGRLWLLDSGTGRFGYVDPANGHFEEVCFCPGYGRGLALTGDFAVIALSLPRHDKAFQDLQLDEQLSRRHAAPRCGLLVVDLRSGDTVHSLRFDRAVEEIYGVAALSGVKRPGALGLNTAEIRRTITVARADGAEA